MSDPLVHAYVQGKMIGGCLGIVLGVALIVFASCQPIHSAPRGLPVPPLPAVAPAMAPEPSLLPTVTPTPQVEYKCDRWKHVDCQLTPEWGEL